MMVLPEEKYLSYEEDHHRRPQSADQDNIRNRRRTRERQTGDRARQEEARKRFHPADAHFRPLGHAVILTGTRRIAGMPRVLRRT